ncbi:MAG TPA: glycosyl hydrolase [Solirubrobacterales bacterium]|nr:glycosyl hydrolase [Solirubrobacterales bacterium]
MEAQARSPHARRIALVVVGALLCALLLQAGTAAAKKKARPLYWGAVIGKQLTGESPPWDFGALEKFERQTGKGASLLSFSAPFTDCSFNPCRPFPFPEQAMEQLRRHGTIPFLNWASQSVPSSLDQPDFSLPAIANGSQDAYIRDYAEQVVTWNRPFFLRFDAEMNGFWFPWSEGLNGNTPGSFVAAWRHVHDIFEQVGANKVTWVWCPNVDFTRKLTPLKELYPGNAYVDWTCLDGFNWGRTRNSKGWQSFDQVFRGTYKRVVKIAPSKPMVIGEVASEERGGSKANWIKSALRNIPAHYPKVRALIWFDEKDQGMDWPLESSRSSLKAFRKAIGRPIYRPNAFSDLPPGRITPPGPALGG